MTEQKHTIWYGIGETAKELGPAAWEKRIQKVIDEKIVPKSSSKFRELIKKHRDGIAKVGGWVATGLEVGMVAGVVYGGVHRIKKMRLKHIPKGPDLVQRTPVPAVVASPRQAEPLIDEDLLFGSAEWFEREAKKPARSEKISPDILRLGRSVTQAKKSERRENKRLKELREQIACRRGGLKAGDVSAWRGSAKPLETVTSEKVPAWLRKLATPEPPPQFIQTMIERRAKARASEAAAVPVNPPYQAWWDERKGWESNPPSSVKVAVPVSDNDLPPFLRKRFPEGPSKKSLAPQQTVQSNMLFAPSERGKVIPERIEGKPVVKIRERIRDILHKPEAARKAVLRARVSATDSVLVRESSELVAAIARKVATLPTNETTSTQELTTLLVRAYEKKGDDKFRPFIQALRAALKSRDDTVVLKSASSLLEIAYNSQPGVKEIDAFYSTKFSTLAAFWLQRLGRVGLRYLLG